MRIDEIYLGLIEAEKALSGITLYQTPRMLDGKPIVVIDNLNRLQAVLNFLSKLDISSDVVAKLKKHDYDFSKMDFKDNEGGVIYSQIGSLKLQIKQYIALVSKLIPEETETTVSVRLPDSNNLTKISELGIRLDKALNQIITTEGIEGQVVLVGFYTGSIWAKLELKSLAAVALFGSVLQAAINFNTEYQKKELIQMEVEKMSIRNEFLSELKDANKKTLDMLLDQQVKMVYGEHFKKQDAELESRLKNSVREMSGLLLEGTRFEKALLPEHKHPEIPFPSLELQEGSGNDAVKLLTAGGGNGGETKK